MCRWSKYRNTLLQLLFTASHDEKEYDVTKKKYVNPTGIKSICLQMWSDLHQSHNDTQKQTSKHIYGTFSVVLNPTDSNYFNKSNWSLVNEMSLEADLIDESDSDCSWEASADVNHPSS